MDQVVIVIHLLIVIALVGVVLVQKSEGGGLGIGGGGGGGFMSTRGTANVLTRTTTYLAIAFFVTSMVLGILANQNRAQRGGSVLDRVAPTTQGAPGAPSVPGSGGGVLDQLRPQTPAVPAPPVSQ